MAGLLDFVRDKIQREAQEAERQRQREVQARQTQTQREGFAEFLINNIPSLRGPAGQPQAGDGGFAENVGDIFLREGGGLDIRGGVPGAPENLPVGDIDRQRIQDPGAVQALVETVRNQASVRREQALEQLKRNEKNLELLGRLDPKLQTQAVQLIMQGDQNQIQQAQAEIQDAGKVMTEVLRHKDNPAKMDQIIRENAASMIANDPNADIDTSLDFLNRSADGKLALAESMQLKARTFAEVLKTSQGISAEARAEQTEIRKEERAEQRVIRKEGRAAQPGFTLTPGQRRFGPTGREIARVEAAPPAPEARTTLAKNLELAGIDPRSPEGIKIIKESITKPGVKIDLNKGLDFKIPTGFQLLDPNNPTKGVTPIPGGPKDNLTGENAGKAQMLRTAQKAAKGIEKLVFDADGSLNRTNLFNAAFGTPGTDGRELRIKMEFGIQGITRIETGAAMPESEVDNTRERFMPSVFDSIKIAKLKLQMFNEFLGGTLRLLDPTGRFDAARFNEELINRGGQAAPATTGQAQPEPTTTQPQRNIVVDF